MDVLYREGSRRKRKGKERRKRLQYDTRTAKNAVEAGDARRARGGPKLAAGQRVRQRSEERRRCGREAAQHMAASPHQRDPEQSTVVGEQRYYYIKLIQ